MLYEVITALSRIRFRPGRIGPPLPGEARLPRGGDQARPRLV